MIRRKGHELAPLKKRLTAAAKVRRRERIARRKRRAVVTRP